MESGGAGEAGLAVVAVARIAPLGVGADFRSHAPATIAEHASARRVAAWNRRRRQFMLAENVAAFDIAGHCIAGHCEKSILVPFS